MFLPTASLTEYERSLFSRATEWSPSTSWMELTAEELQRIAQQEGVEFATALLYERICRSHEHGPAIRRINSEWHSVTMADEPHPMIAIVPGACYKESSESRDSIRHLWDESKRLGLPVELIPTKSFGPLAENAAIIRRRLSKLTEQPVILVSLSKGGADVKVALNSGGATDDFRQVVAWVNLSGLINGSEWVHWLLNRRISRLLTRAWCWYWRYRFSAVSELLRGQGTALDFELRVPKHVKVIHVVGFPLPYHLTHPYTRRSFRRLSPLGPSDGMGIMLGDLHKLPGIIYPVWGADHFLRPAGSDVRHLVTRILHYLGEESLSSGAWPVPTDSVT